MTANHSIYGHNYSYHIRGDRSPLNGVLPRSHLKVNNGCKSAILNLIKFKFCSTYPSLTPHFLFYSNGLAITDGFADITYILLFFAEIVEAVSVVPSQQQHHHLSSSTTMTPVQQSTVSDSRKRISPGLVEDNWSEIMEIPWSDMVSKVKTALRGNKHPKKGERLLTICIAFDAMWKHNANLTLAQAANVTKRIVHHKSDCFEDRTIEGAHLGHGHHSITS